MTPGTDEVVLAIAGMAAITYGVRLAGLVLARSMPAPPVVASVLGHLGGAVMVALVASSLGRGDVAGVAATVVAVATASRGRPTLALGVGMAVAAAVRAL